MWRSDAKNGKISVSIVTDLVCFVPLPLGQRHFNLRCTLNDVAVGQNETVGSEYEARTRTATTALLLHLDLDDRRTYSFRRRNDSFRIGIK
jgi:hypothetical protein